MSEELQNPPETQVIAVDLKFHQLMEAPTLNFFTNILGFNVQSIIFHSIYIAVTITRRLTNMEQAKFIELVNQFWQTYSPPVNEDNPC